MTTNKEEIKMKELASNSSPKKPKKKDKMSLGEKFELYKSEFNKIIWPTKKELIKQTATVIFVSAMFGIFVVSLDILFSSSFSFIYEKLSSF